ncbi:MAG: TlpA disulfide reductase family protein [Spirochaetales bacterium]
MSPAPLYFLAGYVLFRVLTLVVLKDKALRSAWDTRVAVSLVAALLFWKVTPLFTRWDLVLDNPLLLLYMNGGFTALTGAASMGLTILAIGVWQVRRIAETPRWRLLVPLAAGALLAVALFWAEPLWSMPAPAASDSAQLLVPTVAGPPAALVEAKGKVLVVNFWATWCPPCKAELPDLQDFVKIQPPGVVLWGVDLLGSETGGQSAVEAYLANHAMTWKQLLDDGALQRAYSVTVVPTTLVFDPAGQLVERRVGAVDLSWLKGLAARYGH